MNGPSGYHAKWNKRTTNTIWVHPYVEYKKKNKINEETKLSKNKYVDTEYRVVVTSGEGEIGKVNQMYGDGRKLEFWSWTCYSVYRNRNIMYLWNLHNITNQC